MDSMSKAIEFWGMGISVIPIKPLTKQPLVRHWTPYRDRLTSPEEIALWFSRWGLRSYGVVCGKRHGQEGYLSVIDFDDLETAFDWYNRFGGVTFTVATSRGMHAYFITQEPSANAKLGAIEVKANGYVLGAGSLHPSGCEYIPIDDVPIAVLPTLRTVLPDPPPTPTEQPEPRLLRIAPKPPADAWESAENIRSNLVETIRRRFDIVSFFPDAVPSDPSGRWYMTRCPFHDDQTPSFWIDAQSQVCKCFVCTPRPLDVINLCAMLWGVSNATAIERLRQMLS